MDKKILKFQEGCELLGLSPSYVYKLTSAKLIPFSKPMGKVIYFTRTELEAWMAGKWQPERTKVAATHVTLNPVG